jgi:hypothetical protein
MMGRIVRSQLRLSEHTAEAETATVEPMAAAV